MYKKEKILAEFGRADLFLQAETGRKTFWTKEQYVQKPGVWANRVC